MNAEINKTEDFEKYLEIRNYRDIKHVTIKGKKELFGVGAKLS